jgi:hypothetical protein
MNNKINKLEINGNEFKQKVDDRDFSGNSVKYLPPDFEIQKSPKPLSKYELEN